MAMDFRKLKSIAFLLEKNVKIFDKSACQYQGDYDILRMLQKNTYMVISVGATPILRSMGW